MSTDIILIKLFFVLYLNGKTFITCIPSQQIMLKNENSPLQQYAAIYFKRV